MKEETTISLIISTYNWPEALELCLNSIFTQTIQPFEIIIADDGSRDDTRQLIEKMRKKTNTPIIHIWHEDKGFRLSTIRNRSIKEAKGNYIIQIDGDIIVSPHFIEDHLNMAEKGCFIRGTRVMLNPLTTEYLFKNKKISIAEMIQLAIKQPANAIRLSPIAKLCTRKELSGKRVKGCNMSFWKEDLIAINGYDNTLEGWGHEDEELSWRLVNLGRYKKIIKFSAIAYHIYHKLSSREEEPHHLKALQYIQENHIIRTNNGIEEIL